MDGCEPADGPRRVGNGWEVDVRRADGSLAEVALDDSLQLLEFDEELGPRGTPAHDQVVRAARERAIAAARPASSGGPVRSVERQADGTIEVDVVTSDRAILEVELDRQLRVRDVDEEDIGDEWRLVAPTLVIGASGLAPWSTQCRTRTSRSSVSPDCEYGWSRAIGHTADSR